MRRPRARALPVAVLAAAAAGALVLAQPDPPESRAEPSASQTLFRRTLIADPGTKTAIKRLLSDRGGIVAPAIAFTDLTGDGREDAVVRVDAGGAAGTVAVFLLSTDGQEEGPLRVVYRSQSLYRAVVRAAQGALTVRTPEWERGDDVCCPAMQRERTYTWSGQARTLRRRGDRVVATERR